MNYTNEYPSEDEIKNYKLDELFFRYSRVKKLLPGNRLSWTVDKGQKSFLMKVKAGREEEYNQVEWVFYKDGEKYLVEAWSSYRGSSKLTDKECIWVWSLVSFKNLPDGEWGHAPSEINAAIRQALKVYGYGGLEGPEVKTVVE